MLEAQSLRIAYGRVVAVHEASISVGSGEIVALVGGNGNGKSTILRGLAGLNPLQSGAISLAGAEITALPAHERVARGLVLVPEGRRLFARLSVEKNLLLGAYTRRDASERAATLESVFETFPILKERHAQEAGTLSGGEQQMLAIGRGLMAKPKLLMLDEPSWGIAPKIVSKIFETIRLINASGVSILLVEQNLEHALRLSQRAYVVQTGRIVLAGPSGELAANDAVRRAYLGV